MGMNQLLGATYNYAKHPEGWERGKPEQGLVCLLETPPCGLWNYSSAGISENFFERVRLSIAEAGRTLPDYLKGTDPEDFWLYRLYLDLVKNESDLLLSTSTEGGMILSVCVASATYCARLERQAIKQPKPEGQTYPRRVSRAPKSPTELDRGSWPIAPASMCLPTRKIGKRRASPRSENAQNGHRSDADERNRERKGDLSLLGERLAGTFRTAQQYLGISERHRQNLIRRGSLEVQGKGHNKQITTESLKKYLPPKKPN